MKKRNLPVLIEKKIKRNGTNNEPDENGLSYVRLFLLFMFGCVAGVLLEGFYCLATKGRWESHVVSVWGPFNILYGAGAVAFYVGADKLQDQRLVVRVIIMTLAATILELLCGFVLKYALGMRAWNYKNKFMNFRGYICLGFSLGWGVAALAFCLIYPAINKLLRRAKGKTLVRVCSVLTAFMVINVGLAGAAIVRWSNRHYGIEATNKIEKTLDNLAPDEWMEKKFMDWKFIK